jgi:hypothetical protein
MAALDPAEAATLFRAGTQLAFVGAPDEPFVLGRWMGEPVLCVAIPAGDLEAYFTAHPVTLYPLPEPPPAQAPPVVRDIPYASGPSGHPTATVGDTVGVTMGNWENEPTAYGYAWKVRETGGVVDLNGEIAPTYETQDADGGNAVFCAVTATNALGSTSVDSNDVVIEAVRR